MNLVLAQWPQLCLPGKPGLQVINIPDFFDNVRELVNSQRQSTILIVTKGCNNDTDFLGSLSSSNA